MRAGIYARVSTEEQARRGYSLADQRSVCRERALALGAEEVAEFVDEGVSGELLDGRPGLGALREAVRNGQIDLVVCFDPDRLSRNLAHQLLLTDEIEKAGVRLEFVNFEWQNTPDGRLFYALRGAIAEYEKEKIRERTLRGKLQKARQGKLPVGACPYGYRYREGSLEPHPEEAEVVRAIYRWFVGEDLGINGVASRLTARGVPTRKGRPQWQRCVVRRILTDPVYTGTWYYNRRDCRGVGYNRFLPPQARAKITYREEKGWIAVPVPPLIEKELWEQAQEKLRSARRLWSGWAKEEYLLSGLVSCGDCGNPMHGMTKTRRRGTRVRGYTCLKSQAGSYRPGCRRPLKWVRAEAVEEAVWEKVKDWLRDPEALAREIEQQFNDGEWRRELARLEKHLSEVEKGQDNLRAALAAGLLDLDAATARTLAELKNRKKQLLARKRELEVALEGRARVGTRFRELKRRAAEFLGRLDELTLEEKKALVRALVRQVVVFGRGEAARVVVYAALVAEPGVAPPTTVPSC
ncbi:MAG: recombinase family protein [Moorellales bacterium]